MAEFEELLTNKSVFPLDAFIQDTAFHAVQVVEHWHDCFEILYMLKGEAIQKINNHEFYARQGDVILVKSGDIHSTNCNGTTRTQILVIKFMPSIVDIRYFKLDGSKYVAAFINKELKSINNMNETSRVEMQNILCQIYREYTQQNKAFDLQIRGYIYELITLLVRNDVITIPDQTVRDYDIKRMAPVLQYMEQNYNQQLTLEDIADILHMNYSYVSKFFKKITGKTFKQYLDYIRICEADKQIIDNVDYVYRIAQNCGFSSVQAFNRVYKRIRGYAPTDRKEKNC